MRRRLLDNLKKRVECRQREHMDFVDDVHTLFGNSRRKHRFLPEIPDVVYAGIRRCVQFHDVQNASVVNPPAETAIVAGVAVHRVLTVDRLGQYSRTGGLAGSSRADKNIGMREMPRADLGLEGFGDVLLADHIVKHLRSPLAIKRLIHLLTPLNIKNVALDKTAHPSLGLLSCPLRRQPAQTRLPRGTRKAPLNAARFPA